MSLAELQLASADVQTSGEEGPASRRRHSFPDEPSRQAIKVEFQAFDEETNQRHNQRRISVLSNPNPVTEDMLP